MKVECDADIAVVFVKGHPDIIRLEDLASMSDLAQRIQSSDGPFCLVVDNLSFIFQDESHVKIKKIKWVDKPYRPNGHVNVTRSNPIKDFNE